MVSSTFPVNDPPYHWHPPSPRDGKTRDSPEFRRKVDRRVNEQACNPEVSADTLGSETEWHMQQGGGRHGLAIPAP
jgi:hypothetical protein